MAQVFHLSGRVAVIAFSTFDTPLNSLLAQSAIPPALLLVLGAGIGVVLVMGVLFLIHKYTLGAARSELDKYKEQVVALSDKIDALNERHKLLPHLDKDFTVPMAGETLEAYNAVSSQLERHRGEWLKFMDVWEQSQSQLQSESLLGSRRAREVRRQIKTANVTAELAAVARDCEAPLDRMEQAHQQVTEKWKSFEQMVEQLQGQQQSLQAATVTIEFYQSEAGNAKALVEQSRTLVKADPLGSLRRLDEAHAKITTLNQTAAKILEHVRASREAADRIEQVSQLAAQRRAQGFLLREQQADPDPALNEARQQHSIAWQELNRAHESAAATGLAKVVTLVTQAQQGIDQHVAARSKCESEIPTRRSDGMRLGSMQSVVRNQQTELERDFAPDNWFPVSGNLTKAQNFLATAQQLTESAAQHAAANLQNYFQASKLLAQAAENHKQAESALTAIGQKLRELVELRMKCQSQIGQLRVQADRVARLLQSNTADRVRANERFRSANASLDSLTQASRMPCPDWTRLTNRVSEIQADFKRAEEMAQEDIQLAQQAAAEIAETEGVIRQARTFQELGFVPDLSAADTQLNQARGKLTAQDYEESIRLANVAEQLARDARNDAVARAQRRQQEIDSQRRAEEAARATATPTPNQLFEQPLVEGERIV